jgi:penicillin-binding protein 2
MVDCAIANTSARIAMKLFQGTVYIERRNRWVEDAAPLGVGPEDSGYLGAAVADKRIIIFGVCAAVLLCMLGVRVVQLQLVQGTAWRVQSDRNRLRLQPIIPERGILFDRNMVPLVTNVPNFRLTLRAQDLPRGTTARESVIRTIGETVGVGAEKIEQILQAFQKYAYASVVVKDPITYEEAVQVYLKSAAYPGLTIERSAKRQYVAGVPGAQTPLPESMAHVLGYLGRISADELEVVRDAAYYPTDLIGKTGLEAALEVFVRGVPGAREAEMDARGAERRTISLNEPLPGAGIQLTIDLEVQRQLEAALQHGMDIVHRTRGAAVAIDPRTGAILGMVSLPGFDPNLFSNTISQKEYATLAQNPDQPLLNRVVGGQFPSGSTLKPFIAATALQEKIITPSSTVNSVGGIQLGSHFFPDWKAGGHGVTDVRKALAQSVNTFFYAVGGGYGSIPGLGPDRMKKYLEYFGFSKLTDVQMPGETRGFVPSPAWKQEARGEQWYPGDTYNMAIGQGDILVTPLQMAMGISAIANGGTLWKPQLVSARLNADGSSYIVAPEVRAKIPIDAGWLQVVREGMRQTVLAGSARSLGALPVAIAGKTGTAQWSATKSNHAWFVSFAPYEAPRIVTVFLIEEGIEGATAAVPAAKQFYAWWGNYAQLLLRP